MTEVRVVGFEPKQAAAADRGPLDAWGGWAMTGRRPSGFDLLSIGVMNALLVGGGTIVGWLADERLGTGPLWVMIGLLAGIVAGLLASAHQIRKYL